MAYWPLVLLSLSTALLVVGITGTATASSVGASTTVVTPTRAMMLLSLITGAVGFTPLWTRGRVETMRRSRRRFWSLIFKSRWPELARSLGWDVSYREGEYRIPDLLGAKWATDTRFELACRPLAKQQITKWPEMAEQLRREMGASAAEWVEDQPGVLLIKLEMQPIPNQVPFRWPQEISRGRFVLGVAAGDRQISWHPFEVPHLLVAGSTQGGKGGAVRVIAAQALVSGWQVVAINPKMSGEFGWLSAKGCTVANDVDEALAVLRNIFGVLTERQAVVRDAGVGSWQAMYTDWAPVMVIVDEAASLLMPNKANKPMAAAQTEIGDLLARMAMVGRSVGVHIVMATQRPDATSLGPAGGQLRNNLDARIAVCSLDAEGQRMMFATTDVGPNLIGIKGRAVVTKLQAGDMATRALQVYQLDETAPELVHLLPAVDQQLMMSPEVSG